MTPGELWDLQQIALTCICHVQTIHEVPKIWAYIANLKTDKAHTTLDTACLLHARSFQVPPPPPKINHMVAVLLLGLSFHMEDPDGVRDSVNIFMFPDLYLTMGTEASLVAQWWDTLLE